MVPQLAGEREHPDVAAVAQVVLARCELVEVRQPDAGDEAGRVAVGVELAERDSRLRCGLLLLLDLRDVAGRQHRPTSVEHVRRWARRDRDVPRLVWAAGVGGGGRRHAGADE
jgi:hypothetical protein